jgi:hypothetical protein
MPAPPHTAAVTRFTAAHRAPPCTAARVPPRTLRGAHFRTRTAHTPRAREHVCAVPVHRESCMCECGDL